MQLATMDSTKTMTTREIAEIAEASHDNVVKSIRALIAGGGVFKTIPLERSYVHPQNKQTYNEFVLGYRDTMVVISGYSAPVRAKIIDRWQELEAKQVAPPVELSRMEILMLAMESEKGRLLAIEQRDHAIATKAQIGSRREATAMATASAAKKESAKLKALMGEAMESASILSVQNKTGASIYKWQDLKNYCKAAGLSIGKSFNPGLQLNVNTYPAAAWFEIYGVDLAALFGPV